MLHLQIAFTTSKLDFKQNQIVLVNILQRKLAKCNNTKIMQLNLSKCWGIPHKVLGKNHNTIIEAKRQKKKLRT